MTQLLSLLAGAWIGYRLGQQVTNDRWHEWLGYDDGPEFEEPSFVESQRDVAEMQ